MDVTEVQEYCRSFPGTREEMKDDPINTLSYRVGKKKFAYFKTSTPEKWRFSVRVSPEQFVGLTDQDGIKPARYMHRFHWITIVQVNSLPADYLKELIRWSYSKALSTLPKRERDALDTRSEQLLAR